jgi:hypothetical protein
MTDGMFKGTMIAAKSFAGVMLAVCLLGTKAEAQAQGKLAAAPSVTYANKWEFYGGIMLQNDQAGQNLPKRINLGGVELLGTRWLTKKWGVGGDFRGMAGTTPVFANPYTSRPLVVLYEGMGGVEYRALENQRAAMNLHAFGGAVHGVFDKTPLPAGVDVGLYTNRTSPMGVVGASFDINQSRKIAFRLSPDLVVEHLGTETREFFAISGGVVYRFGNN